MDQNSESAKKIFYDSLDSFHAMMCSAIEDEEGQDFVIDSIHKLKGQKDANYLELLKKLRSKHSIYMRAIRTPNESIAEFQKSQRLMILILIESSAKTNNKPLIKRRAQEILSHIEALIQRTTSEKNKASLAGLFFYCACFLDLARIKTYLAMLSAISCSKKSN